MEAQNRKYFAYMCLAYLSFLLLVISGLVSLFLVFTPIYETLIYGKSLAYGTEAFRRYTILFSVLFLLSVLLVTTFNSQAAKASFKQSK